MVPVRSHAPKELIRVRELTGFCVAQHVVAVKAPTRTRIPISNVLFNRRMALVKGTK